MLPNDVKNKILFLWLDDKEFHSVQAQRRGVTTAKVYKDISKPLKVIRRIQIILGVFSIYLWLENWKKSLNKYDVVIIHASKITSPVVKYIKNKNPRLRIIVWYWNPVNKCESLDKYPESMCERWTFDEVDAKSYGLRYNTQYYFMDYSIADSDIDKDVFFLGGDKGRLDQLLALKQQWTDLQLKVYFHITKTRNDYDPSYNYKPRMSYKANLVEISKSTAILDIISEGQHGLTLRPLEALCFGKKLITNDEGIMRRDFYDKNNIFILQKDSAEELKAFLSCPIKQIDSSILMKYDFDSWLSRFFI